MYPSGRGRFLPSSNGAGHGWGQGPTGPHRGRHRVFDRCAIRVLVLGLIAERPGNREDLIGMIEERSAAVHVPGPDVISPALTWLEEAGEIEAVQTEGHALFRVTETGHAALAAGQDQLAAIMARLTGTQRSGARDRGGFPAMRAKENLQTAVRTQLRNDGLETTAEHRIASILDGAARAVERAGEGGDAQRRAMEDGMTAVEPASPVIRRVRHALRRRALTVMSVERAGTHMIRVTLTGEALEDFVSLAPDDHIKIFLPDPVNGEVRRDYTPRRHDRASNTLVVDFVDHAGGPAADWARSARFGDRLEIAGPKGSGVIEGPISDWVLVGDETALPAIGRRVEELDAGIPVTTLVAVPGPGDEQVFVTAARHEARWLHRPVDHADRPDEIIARLERMVIGPATFVWVAAEGGVARAVRRYLIEERGIAPQWIKAAGYWQKGHADASVKDVG